MTSAPARRPSAEIVHVEPKLEAMTKQERASLCLFFKTMVTLATSDNCNITLRQLAVLVTTGEGSYSARDINRLLGIPKPAIVRVCDQLEGRGLLVRAPHERDGRLVVLQQTPAGAAFMKALVASWP